MSKRTFRQVQKTPLSRPTYPTLEEFDRGRRGFLSKLGLALLGAGSLSTLAQACGSRPLMESVADSQPFPMPGGKPQLPDSRVDTYKNNPDLGQLKPDVEIDGEPPFPDARVDTRIPKPDMEPPFMGEMMPLDARIDTWVPEPDMEPLLGDAPQPDARIDTK